MAGAAVALTMTLAGTSPAQAEFIRAYADANDCAGTFGPNFPNCYAPAEPNFGIPERTPIIIKINFNADGSLGTVEVNVDLFPTISLNGSEFTFDFGGDGETGDGTWTYTPGAGDPDITAFTAKGGAGAAGGGFNFYSTRGDYSDVAYSTPINPRNGKPFGLSHLSFYDTDGGQQQVPEPGSLALLGLSLLGLGLVRRRSH